MSLSHFGEVKGALQGLMQFLVDLGQEGFARPLNKGLRLPPGPSGSTIVRAAPPSGSTAVRVRRVHGSPAFHGWTGRRRTVSVSQAWARLRRLSWAGGGPKGPTGSSPGRDACGDSSPVHKEAHDKLYSFNPCSTCQQPTVQHSVNLSATHRSTFSQHSVNVQQPLFNDPAKPSSQ